MKTLYLDCQMGAAGDMMAAALLELFTNPAELVDELNALNIPHVQYELISSVKCGIQGSHLKVLVHGIEESATDVPHMHHYKHVADASHCAHEHTHHHVHECRQEHEHDHTHRTLHDITHILSHINISDHIRNNVLAVYQLIADAESKAHGVPVNEIHFHEVGNLDAVADITAVCFLMDHLGVEKVYASPVHVGSGQVRCAHGILPVPAPATAYILQGCPIYGGAVQGELCTPTGAALLKYFVDEFGHMPPMSISSIGYGMGKKDFPAANCIRAMLGECDFSKDEIFELCCNVDDMTAEQIGYALECFFKEGAVDAFTTPIQMKKSRPGTLITVLCHENLKEQMIRTMFRHTSTAGIRETKTNRSILSRSITEIETAFGPVHKKDYSGYGISRSKYEYEDLARIASITGMSIAEILKNING